MRAVVRALAASMPRTVWLLGLISLLNDTASEMVYPLLPLFVVTVLGAGPRALGLIEGLAEAVASLLKLVSGAIYDRSRRAKPWVVWGYGIAGLTRPLIAFIALWPALLVLRVLDRIGKGLRSSPRDALLAASAGPQRRGLAFGFHRAMDNLGGVVGPLIATALLAAGLELRTVFFLSIVPAIGVLVMCLWIREPDEPAIAVRAPMHWRWRELSLAYRRYLVVMALFTLGNASHLFVLLRARELGLSEAQVPLAWAAIGLTAALLLTPLSALSDRIGRKRLIIGGWTIHAAVYLALGVSGMPWLAIWAVLIGHGLFIAATEGAEKALVADLAQQGYAGSTFGWYHLTLGVMLLPGSALFGWLWERVAPMAAFGFGAGCSLVAALLLWQWVPGRMSSEANGQ
jgi:MFS family permease